MSDNNEFHVVYEEVDTFIDEDRLNKRKKLYAIGYTLTQILEIEEIMDGEENKFGGNNE